MEACAVFLHYLKYINKEKKKLQADDVFAKALSDFLLLLQ